jgi:hypothetical protein
MLCLRLGRGEGKKRWESEGPESKRDRGLERKRESPAWSWTEAYRATGEEGEAEKGQNNVWGPRAKEAEDWRAKGRAPPGAGQRPTEPQARRVRPKKGKIMYV